MHVKLTLISSNRSNFSLFWILVALHHIILMLGFWLFIYLSLITRISHYPNSLHRLCVSQKAHRTVLCRDQALNNYLINTFKKFVRMDFFKLKLPFLDVETLTLYKDQGQKQTSDLLILKK